MLADAESHTCATSMVSISICRRPNYSLIDTVFILYNLIPNTLFVSYMSSKFRVSHARFFVFVYMRIGVQHKSVQL